MSDDPAGEELYFFHREPMPAVCDVCAYVQATPEADQLVEHTKVRIAIGLMVEDLGEYGTPMHMVQLHRSTFGFPGPEHTIEPRHWFWALLVYPGFRITLDGRATEGG